ncbi:hypothetical protein GCM10007100_11370 [Roseibacillus persicicus]|uniref:Uncharacterized protein n=1 Tax=Roseibacillus persicicus TaxID=454148 RepID=A0A918WFT8_9BACT|nr:hypothetical protein GCM10007100_11370 [Roseibacillus persicicus]
MLELHDGAGEGGLAATGFAHQSENFAFFKCKGNAIDGLDHIAAAFAEEATVTGKMNFEVVYTKKHGREARS